MEWISVKDKLPKNTNAVIFWDSTNNVFVKGYYSNKNSMWVSEKHFGYRDGEITHWMLPSPPELINQP